MTHLFVVHLDRRLSRLTAHSNSSVQPYSTTMRLIAAACIAFVALRGAEASPVKKTTADVLAKINYAYSFEAYSTEFAKKYSDEERAGKKVAGLPAH